MLLFALSLEIIAVFLSALVIVAFTYLTIKK